MANRFLVIVATMPPRKKKLFEFLHKTTTQMLWGGLGSRNAGMIDYGLSSELI
jgi:hypothetical protein